LADCIVTRLACVPRIVTWIFGDSGVSESMCE